MRGRVEESEVRRLEIREDRHVVAANVGPPAGVESGQVVEALDRAVEESAAVVHAAQYQVSAPAVAELVVQRDVELRELHIEEEVLARQRLDFGELSRAKLAPAWQGLDVFLGAFAERPGVLVGEFRLDRPGALGRIDRVRRAHVEAQESEGRQVACA